MMKNEAKKRVIIECLSPEVSKGGGEGVYPAKSSQGEWFPVRAAAFADGHDEIRGRLLYRHESESEWLEVPFQFQSNDEWESQFLTQKIETYLYTAEFWVDPFLSWYRAMEKRLRAAQLDQMENDLLSGIEFLKAALKANPQKLNQRVGTRRTRGLQEEWQDWIERLEHLRGASSLPKIQEVLLDGTLESLVLRTPFDQDKTRYPRELKVNVERERARFSSWYEFFPRSTGEDFKHGTLKDATRFLDYVASMGFNVVYLPPIHPIGKAFRKGKNNSLTAGPEEPGSPWAIGSEEGGHKAIHPQLGGFEDFGRFLRRAEELGIEVALDLAFQCSPDHPYVKEHPEWFKWRADGSIQYAENPPKKYQDIYPLHFECDEWESLWNELKSVVLFWVERGVRIFRVDNPHTKSFRFWEWLIAEVKGLYPDVLFLSEAFTRPHIMYHLAKIGFSQSYTYFTWRVSQHELRSYMEELTQSPVRDFFRPCFWPNTPDILPFHLQEGGRPAFMIRLLLAAMLSSNYGIYGPAFELHENRPLQQGKEEYLDSEKYEIKNWNLNQESSLKDFTTLLNRIRNVHPAFQYTNNVRFHSTDNDQLLCFSKRDPESPSKCYLIIVNLDWAYPQMGWTDLDLPSLGIGIDEEFDVEDLLSGVNYRWKGARNFVKLAPEGGPGHVFTIKRTV